MAATPASLNRLHLIATGGSIMHNLALALHRRGARVTGSDDEIFEPAKSRLAAAGLLPAREGWFPEKITADLDAVSLVDGAARHGVGLVERHGCRPGHGSGAVVAPAEGGCPAGRHGGCAEGEDRA